MHYLVALAAAPPFLPKILIVLFCVFELRQYVFNLLSREVVAIFDVRRDALKLWSIIFHSASNCRRHVTIIHTLVLYFYVGVVAS